MPNPKLERYFTPACGSQNFTPAGSSGLVDPRYNPASGTFYNLPDARIVRRTMKDGVQQHDLPDFRRRSGGARENASLKEFLAKLRAEEAAAASDDDFHRGT